MHPTAACLPPLATLACGRRLAAGETWRLENPCYYGGLGVGYSQSSVSRKPIKLTTRQDDRMIQRFLGVIEILVSLYLIFCIATHTATTRDYMVFLVITVLFSINMARGQAARRERHGELSRAKARSNYDHEKYRQMREDLEARKSADDEEDEYETHPINVQEFAAKLYRGEVTLDDLPDTRSKAAREYGENNIQTEKTEEEI